MKFQMVDVDSNGGYDIIGEVVTSMNSVMLDKKNCWTSKITLPGKTADRGTIIVRGQYVKVSHITAKF